MSSLGRCSVESAGTATSLCNSHQRSLTVFCQECGVALCDSCLSNGDHRNHQFSSLLDACMKRLDELMKNNKELARSIKKQGNFTSDASITNSIKYIEANFLKTKENLDAMFSELRDLLEVNKIQAFKLLAAQQKHMEAQLTELKTKAEIHEELERLKIQTGQTPDNASSVQTQCVELEKRIEIIDNNFVDWEKKDDHLRRKSLENSVRMILEKSKSCLTHPLKFVDFITFDKNTAHEKLSVSEDNRQVTLFAKDMQSNQSQPDKAQDARLLHVQAEQTFTAGQHYWEVDVRGCRSWEIGVVGEEGTEKLSWTLRLDDGVLTALHNHGDFRVREQDLLFLGVFLDCDKGRLWFYNVDTDATIHTFPVRRGSGRTMRPVFSIAPEEEDEFSCLVLCNICENDPRPASMADSCVDSPNAH
ncbi:hypothetical protein AALO_G00227310 [Alosa alosa]|uniref:Uncharacterized protein n=1 Tax=Alosa alosa TaxID=278164 RepID=A0AAV6FYL0_9TELE|nr:zinc-binding protein A33-like [Alosa alosa]KAG5267908.1 hypothetical protein AALO_G00227310 [Alosa alosa]